MFHKKVELHEREKISGHFVPKDVPDGEYGAQELAKRNDSRQADLAEKQKADWPENMTSSVPEKSDPILAYAISHLNRPSDPPAASDKEHFGGSPHSKGAVNPGQSANERKRDAGDVGNGSEILGR